MAYASASKTSLFGLGVCQTHAVPTSLLSRREPSAQMASLCLHSCTVAYNSAGEEEQRPESRYHELHNAHLISIVGAVHEITLGKRCHSCSASGGVKIRSVAASLAEFSLNLKYIAS